MLTDKQRRGKDNRNKEQCDKSCFVECWMTATASSCFTSLNSNVKAGLSYFFSVVVAFLFVLSSTVMHMTIKGFSSFCLFFDLAKSPVKRIRINPFQNVFHLKSIQLYLHWSWTFRIVSGCPGRSVSLAWGTRDSPAHVQPCVCVCVCVRLSNHLHLPVIRMLHQNHKWNHRIW